MIGNAQAQIVPITDTLGYLKSINQNKNQYIGKSFSVLLDTLKLNIVYFGTNAGKTNDKSKETSTRFYFINPESMEDFRSRYIEVYWSPYLDHNIASQIYDDSDGWSIAAKNFYKTGIIREIRVSDDIKNAVSNPKGN